MDKAIRKFFLAIIVIILTLPLAACAAQSKETADKAGTAKGPGKIVIKGLSDKDIEITADELKGMQNVTKQATGIDSEGDSVTYKVEGVLFDDILKKYGKSQKDMKGLRFTAGDGYSIGVPESILKNRDIILALKMNDKELESDSAPARSVIPEERAMYWVKNLAVIEILNDVEKKEAERIIFLDNVSSVVAADDVDFYGKVDKAIKTGDLLDKFKSGEGSDNLFIKAMDKLSKNEAKDNFLKGYIKITGVNIPGFVSNDLPAGMHVKNILWFSCGSDVYFSAKNSIIALDKTTVDDKEGVLLGDVIKEAGIAASDKYVLEGIDGYTAEVESKDIAGGLIYIDDSKNASVYFKDLPKGINIKGILSISVKK